MSRLLLPRLLILALFGVLCARLYQLQITPVPEVATAAQPVVQATRALPVRPIRGEILAADGTTVLAATLPLYTVAIRAADLPPLDTAERAMVYARLNAVLGITATLTISPAVALTRDTALDAAVRAAIGDDAITNARIIEEPRPLTLAVPPGAGGALAALLRRHTPIVALDGALPVDDETQAALGAAAATLGDALTLSTTLTISPASALQTDAVLRDDLTALLGSMPALPEPARALVATVAADRAPAALRLAQAVPQTLSFATPLAERIERVDMPGYQTFTIASEVPRDMVLAIRENASALPGVVVEESYRRNYPLSGRVASLSHILGYIGRADECDLARRNEAQSWVDGLLGSLGSAIECGIIQKPMATTSSKLPQYLDDDRIGKDGVEAGYERELRGTMGAQEVSVDAGGAIVRAPELVQPPVDGSSLRLTIDAGLQLQVEQIVQNWIAEAERRRPLQPAPVAYKRDYKPVVSGVAVVIEIQTGRVLAMVSWPAYDNNIWIDPARSAELMALLQPGDEEKRLARLTGRAVAGQYPPGSTMKQFDAMIALQNAIITPETTVRDPGKLVIEDEFVAGRQYVYPNAYPTDNGLITVSDALKQSSNVFFMSVAGGNRDRVINIEPENQVIEKGIGITALAQGLELFGFGSPTGLRLAGEAPGRVPTPAWKQRVLRQAWTTGDTYNAAIGQGNLEVTPLQLAAAAAAVANDGVLYRPQIVDALIAPDGGVRVIPPEIVRRIPMDPQYFRVVREGMRRSVTEGVNLAARDACSGMTIAGKTGTAEFGPEIQVPTLDGKGLRKVRQSHAWFVGFAPYDAPRYQVLTLVEGAGDLNDGSATLAVPAATQILQAVMGVIPPAPLPRGCQAGMPPLPPRTNPAAPAPVPISDPRDR